VASAGRIGVGIGTGAASGAAIGSAVGPWGTAIGGVVGGIGGAIGSILSASDEAKQRNNARQLLEEQAREASQREWEQRVAAISGLSGNPLYHAMSYEPYDPNDPDSATNQAISRQIESTYPEYQPDYGQLIGSIAGAAGTVGKNAIAQKWGQPGPADTNPWAAYAAVRPTFGAASMNALADAYGRQRYG